jgi:hypothetical protein
MTTAIRPSALSAFRAARPDIPAALAPLDAEAALARWEADEQLRIEAELELAWAER